jgi:hypothetical protein
MPPSGISFICYTLGMDEELKEREALQQAADDGIYFKDTWKLSKVSSISETLPESYNSKEEAEQARAELEDVDQYAVVQVRQRV